MREINSELLRGVIEVDETYVGGHVRGHGRGYKANKAIAIGAVQRGGMIRLATAQNKIRLMINVNAAKSGDFTISSKLLRSAELVTSAQPGR